MSRKWLTWVIWLETTPLKCLLQVFVFRTMSWVPVQNISAKKDYPTKTPSTMSNLKSTWQLCPIPEIWQEWTARSLPKEWASAKPARACQIVRGNFRGRPCTRSPLCPSSIQQWGSIWLRGCLQEERHEPFSLQMSSFCLDSLWCSLSSSIHPFLSFLLLQGSSLESHWKGRGHLGHHCKFHMFIIDILCK